MPMRRADRVGVHTQDLRSGEQSVQLLLDLLRTGADVLHDAAALRAAVIGRLTVAAVMAHQPSVRTVIGHRNAAARTLGHLTAQQHPATAAAVEKENALLAAREIFLQRGAERFADGGLVPRAKLVAQIGDEHLGERFFIVASVKRENLIAPFPRVIHRLDRRRRRAEQQQRAALRAAELRDIARMVARRVFRAVGRLLLLIHDDKSEIRQRRKHRAARAEHDPHVAAADALPLVVALRQLKSAVEHGDVLAEIGGKFRHHLRRERDLRHEQHRRAAHRQCFLNEADIHLRLAAGGHAMQQRLAAGDERQQPVKGLLLLVVEHDGQGHLNGLVPADTQDLLLGK